MTTKNDSAKTGTRRMLAAAAVMCLVVLLAVLMRRGEPVVVVEAAPVAPVAAAQVPATPSPTLAAPEATAELTEENPATHETRVTESPKPSPIVIRVAAEMEGGCELPPHTEVAFSATDAGGHAAIRRATSARGGHGRCGWLRSDVADGRPRAERRRRIKRRRGARRDHRSRRTSTV
jgi:hypothetical protein